MVGGEVVETFEGEVCCGAAGLVDGGRFGEAVDRPELEELWASLKSLALLGESVSRPADCDDGVSAFTSPDSLF